MKLCLICNSAPVARKFCSDTCRLEHKKLAHAQYIKDNREAILESRRKYYENNKESLLQKAREYVSSNRAKIRASQSRYSSNNKEFLANLSREYYIKNRQSLREKSKEYFQDPKIQQRERARARSRYQTDPREKIRNAVSSAFRRMAVNKPVRTEKLLGCTFAEAKSHIESLFLEGMSWSNHGEWHIDHKRPISSVDINNEDEVKAINNIKNLQPLWAKDNLSKGAKSERSI